MSLGIEDYALIGDCHTGALVGVDGSMDWLCLPRFDSASVFAALLGDENHGHWRIAPVDAVRCTDRRYDGDTFTLVTRWVTESGEIEVVDLMPMGGRRADVIRRIRGVRGTVRVEEVLRIRFDYADAIPWIRQSTTEGGAGEYEHALIAVAGPDSVVVRGPRLQADDYAHRAEFDVAEGETVDIVMTWFPSHRPPPPMPDVDERIGATAAWWSEWAARLDDDGAHADAVRRSLLVLRALTHEDTAGIVAAATTSLPEQFGGGRNWDYRYVWLRDAALTLQALMLHGFGGEAVEWRRWLLRAIAGDPADLQIMYGLGGERRLPEWEVASLPGYQGASPVRVGNGAYTQFQGDVFGEVMLALQQARLIGVDEDEVSWPLQQALLKNLEMNLERDDHGLWEIRGVPRRFTQSRAMIWAAFDCGIRAVREHGLPGPAEHWEKLRDALRDEIEAHGFDTERNSYVQYYGGTEVIAHDFPQLNGLVGLLIHTLSRRHRARRMLISRQQAPALSVVAATVSTMRFRIRRRRSDDDHPHSLRAQRELILALDADVDRQLAAAEVASAGITTRASILIAAAGLTSGLQVSEQAVVPAILAVLGALVGVSLLLMRTADEVPILEAETTFWAQPPVVARRNLLHWKNGVLRERELSLLHRRAVLVSGFVLLAASISSEMVVSVIHVLSGGGE